MHGFWDHMTGPVDDSFNVGENPQYIINLSKKAIENKATLWILLSRHVTKQEQEGGEVSVAIMTDMFLFFFVLTISYCLNHHCMRR